MSGARANLVMYVIVMEMKKNIAMIFLELFKEKLYFLIAAPVKYRMQSHRGLKPPSKQKGSLPHMVGRVLIKINVTEKNLFAKFLLVESTAMFNKGENRYMAK
jgi:hypothetical protein